MKPVPLAVRALVAAALFCLPVAAAAQDVTPVTLRSGESVVIAAPALTHIAVGDSKIAGIAAVGDSEIVINGKGPGRTSLFVWRGGRRYAYDVRVTAQSLDDLAKMLAAALRIPGVQVVPFDRSILVRGTVATGEQYARLNDVLARFAKLAEADKYALVDSVVIAQPLGDLQAQLNATDGGRDLRVDRDLKGNLIVSGHARDRAVAEAVLDRVRALAGPYFAADAKLVDRLVVDTISQVDVKVYILEVDRTGLEQLGVRLQNATPVNSGNGVSYVLGDPSISALESPLVGGGGKPFSGPGVPGRALNVGAFYRSVVLAPTLDLIMRSGHARVLSSPNLVTMPGRAATFLVGGEIPIPFASGPQQIAITYKEFGVKLNVTPSLLAGGSVETLIAPEVSDLDFQDGVQINGFTLPALKTSRLSTDVVTRSGESIVMGGMLRRVEQRTIDKIPGLGDLPVLGKIFRSTRYQSSETDIVFVMTPEVLIR